MSEKCRHLHISDEAYFSPDGRVWSPTAGYICGWSSGARVTPIWYDKLVGGGSLIIDPKTVCPTCPCFAKDEAII